MEKENRFQLPENVQFEHDQFELLTQYLGHKNYSKLFVLVDENTKNHCLPLIENQLNSLTNKFTLLTVAAGENSKDIEVCQSLWQSISQENGDRKSCLINLGGGMITDLGGFIASLYKRGIDFLNIPTSLLAMVDASVGGKCGIDFMGYKNQLGVFNTPVLCLIFPGFLNTLPKKELLSGYAEILKHVLIGDVMDINKLPEFSTIPSEKNIRKSIAVKARIVAKDPFEKKERKQLNFGHTIGHAVESYYLVKEKPIPHGFAVAMGMFCEADISEKMGLLSEHEANQIKYFINLRFPKIQFTEKEVVSFMSYLHQDKKNENGVLLFSLLKSVGNCIENQKVEEEIVRTAFLNYIAYQ